MARMPKQFFAGTVAIASASKYTAPTYTPSVQASVLRHFHVSNPGAAGSFSVAIGASDVANTEPWSMYPIGGTTALDFYCYLVIPGGQQIFTQGSPTNQLYMSFNGDENVG